MCVCVLGRDRRVKAVMPSLVAAESQDGSIICPELEEHVVVVWALGIS